MCNSAKCLYCGVYYSAILGKVVNFDEAKMPVEPENWSQAREENLKRMEKNGCACPTKNG